MSTKQFLIILLATLTLIWGGSRASQAFAQSNSPWQTYTNSNCVQDLALEGNYIWAATCGGVVRWNRIDGSYVKYVTPDGLTHHNVRAVAVDGAGYKWFGTPYGLSRFDGQTWTTYTTQNGLPTDNVYALAVDHQGQVWLAGSSGLARFDGQSWIDTTPPLARRGNEFVDIAVDPAGNIWVASPIRVLRFDGQTWTIYTEQDGLTRNAISSIAVDPAGQVWVADISGLSKFDGQRWTQYQPERLQASHGGSTVAVDQAGQVWFANRKGVGIFDGQTWPTFFDEQEFGLDTVQAIAVDEDHHHWLATDHGLVQFDGQHWTRYLTTAGPPSNDVRTIAINPANNEVWAATAAGVSRFDGHQWTTYTTADGLVSDDVTALAIDRAGQVWMGTKEQGVSVFDGHTWKTYKAADSLVGDRIIAIAVDSHGQVWVGTKYNGVSVFDGQRWTSYNRDNGLVGSDIKALAVDQQGQVWVSASTWIGFSRRVGVSRFDGQDWTTYTSQDGLVSSWVNDIFVSQTGDVLFGTSQGVSRFDGRQWTSYTTDDGLFTNGVYALADDPAGNMWINNSKFDGCMSSVYYSRDGLGRSDIRDIVPDGQDYLWFATGGGLSRLDPDLSILETGVDPADNVAVRSLLAGPGQPGRLYALTNQADTNTLIISDDFGRNWQPFAGGLPVEAACLHNLNMDYATPDALYANTCQGLYRWLDGNWTQISAKETGMVSIPYGQPETLWATAPAGPGDVPIWRSDDGGQTWLEASRYLDHANGVAQVTPDPLQADILYATIWPEYADGHLRRGVANGQWTAMPTPLANSPVDAGFTLDGNSGALYVTTNNNQGQLWRTCQPRKQDVKATQWELVFDFGETRQVELLASGWSPNGQALYINLKDVAPKAEPVLHRSLDGGQTWSPVPIKF